MKRSAGWRDRAAVELVLAHLPHLDVRDPALVMEDPLADELVGSAERAGALPSAVAWRRRALGGRPASPWPSPRRDGTYGSAFLRLPRAKDELEMAVHAAADRLAPGGRLYVYGAKDEGAGSAARRIEPLFGDVRTVATGGRCRLLEAVRPERVSGLRSGLAAWRMETEPPHPELEAERWVSFPGVFAAGRLDEGTALLLDALATSGPGLDADSRVLDFGCGDGVIGGVLATRMAGLRPLLLDVDTVALEAASENVPGGVTLVADGLEGLGELPPLDAIVSNPPYHRGKAETVDVVRSLVHGAARLLNPEGTLTMVVQRRLPVDTALARAFDRVDVLDDRGPFRVWRAGGPSPGGLAPRPPLP